MLNPYPAFANSVDPDQLSFSMSRNDHGILIHSA